MKKILAIILMVQVLIVTPIFAQQLAPVPAQPAVAAAPKLSPEEARKKYFMDQFDKWNAMSKEQKLEFVNTQHDKMVKNMAESWGKLTDDKKIEQQEKNYANQKERLGIK